jgi:segregation and condensation protein A
VSLQVAGHQTEGYLINTPVYEGPLDLLLELIEKAELDITRLALAQVTDQYLEYLHHLQDRNPAEVSAFLVIATRLVQIKSAALLPRPSLVERSEQEVDDGEALAQQLIQYRRFKQLAGELENRQNAGLHTYLRVSPPDTKVEARLDLTGITLNDLVKAAWQVFGGKPRLPALSQVVSMPRITIRERIHTIIEALQQKGTATFWTLLKNRSRIEIVVTFLAMLELIKRRTIDASQASLFEDINIQPVGELDEKDETEIEFGE